MSEASSESTIQNLVPVGGTAMLRGSPGVPMTIASWKVGKEDTGIMVQVVWHDKMDVPHGRSFPIEILILKPAL